MNVGKKEGGPKKRGWPKNGPIGPKMNTIWESPYRGVNENSL